ncbi:fungal hydrophobin [Phanerochaete sordida]|uniref:Hydrophobin n=1 Tax=Phanerochaete sordida TaxID=48140 RepID=A0A9P3GRA1_9APHY|nr:fungal hydrophobin [Phanerochaete sordida]
MKFAVATLLALPLLAVATPLEVRQSAGSCSTGSVQCCDSTVSSTSAEGNLLAGLLGIVLGDITGLIGLTCSPISVVGVGSGSECSANVVCCSNTQVGGLIGIGCLPITL